MIRTDPAVCPDCNIADAEIAENIAEMQCFLVLDSEFSGLRVLGFRVLDFGVLFRLWPCACICLL